MTNKLDEALKHIEGEEGYDEMIITTDHIQELVKAAKAYREITKQDNGESK